MREAVSVEALPAVPPALFRGLAFGLMLVAPFWATVAWWAFA